LAHPSNSREQLQAEAIVRELLAKHLGVQLYPKRSIGVGTGRWKDPEVDAYSRDPKILVEIYSRVGSLKSAHIHKISHDILKLITIRESTKKWSGARIVIAFADRRAYRELQERWLGDAANSWGVELILMEVPPEMRTKVLLAQKRQNITAAREVIMRSRKPETTAKIENMEISDLVSADEQ